MKIFDPAILNLPFYDDAHRRLAADLEAWVEAHEWLPREYERLEAAERGRLYTRLLGQDGWLRHAVDPAPGRERPDVRALCLVREAFAYLDDLVDFAFSIQGLAAAPIAWYGSEAQRAAWLPGLRDGTTIGSLALSEPEAGSNLAAVAVEAGRTERGYAVDGLKTWVSNGNIADHHSVLLRTGEGPGGLGLSFLSVPAATAGVAPAGIELLAPRAFASLAFEQAELPADALIGAAGMGFRYAMEILNIYRASVGAAALGFARRALAASLAWSRERPVAGGKLLQQQFTIDKIANMVAFADSTALLVARTAWEFDTGAVAEVAAHASITKLLATDGLARVADDAVQLFGAAGLVAGSLPEGLFRQARALRIYEGTSEIQKIVIAGSVSRRRA
ncbi:acyl-CoA/acyl-ACP dehydrogenase [Burkholderia plantarii]|uniref:acyl-CoA dehydrogenase family protein n=1 Tax=Burkholderia plantarii TaxID=41899 RepID=UPI00272B81E9|nr:acyl-CoA dehydrogenase family protein [Burkholderia plantarii]WLE59396.1 acyl-CoA/acyl-ACP dehydrogenase [Burkholderia plantarii]